MLIACISYAQSQGPQVSQVTLVSSGIQPDVCIPSLSITFHGDGLTGINTFTCPFLTYYSLDGGYGPISSATLPQPGLDQYNSPAAAIAAYNQQNAAWMATCPQTPVVSPTTNSYFINGAEAFVGGDACRASPLPLISEAVYTNEYSWSLFHEADGSGNVLFNNLYKMGLSDVAYSPQLDSGGISTAYDSNTNVFAGVPAGPQHGLWEWFVKFADLGNAPLKTETTTASFGGLPLPSLFGIGGGSDNGGYIPYIALGIGYTPPYEVYPIACFYLYGYTIKTTLQSVSNPNIPYIYQTGANQNATFSTPFLPYILYNFQVNNPSLGNNLYTLNQLSYAAYSPFNYNNPTTSELPINISTPQLFIASYNLNAKQQTCNSGGTGIFGTIGCIWSGLTGGLNTNSVLIPYAYNALTFNSQQSQPIEYPALGEPQLYNYGASNTQLSTAGQNTTNSLIAIRAPLSISAIPNDYIFVLANTTMPEQQPAAQTLACVASSTESNLDIFVKASISNLGVPDTPNNEAFLAAIANAYNTGSDFQYNNPLGVTAYQGAGMGITVTSNLPTPLCTAPDGTPAYGTPGPGETATSDAIQQMASVPSGNFEVYNALVYGLQNNEPLSYYTTNTEASFQLQAFEVSQAQPGDILDTITLAISDYGDSGATTYFVNWATGLTYTAPPPPQPNQQYSGATNSIYVIRAISSGYYNNSVLPPSAFPAVQDTEKTSDTNVFEELLNPPVSESSICATAPDCLAVWNSNWNNYWTSLIKIQSANTYIINQIPISSSLIAKAFGGGGDFCKKHPDICNPPPPCVKSYANPVCIQPQVPVQPNVGSGSGSGGTGSNPPTVSLSFTPMNISSDAVGDVYITGTMNIGGTVSPWIVKISNTIGIPAVTGKLITTANNQIPKDSNGQQLTPTEVAASPDGKLIFITSQHSSDIFVLSGEDLSYLDTYNLVYSADVAPLGITFQGSSYTPPKGAPVPPAPELNITDYLASGGLYGVNTINNAAMQDIINKFKVAGITQLDEQIYHHPVAMQDVNGYLYVLDNWYGGIGAKCTIGITFFGKPYCWAKTNTANFDTLVLRVINSTGQDVPIAPSNYNDVWFQTGTNQYQRYVGSQSAGVYPPFGWIVSASLSDGTGRSSDIINICGLATSNYPCQTPTVSYIQGSNYWPLGPSLSGLDCNSAFKVTILGGTYGCAFLPLSGMGFSVDFNNTVSMLFPSPANLNHGDTSTANQYGELIFTRFPLENYTQFLSPKGPPILQESSCYMDVNGSHIITSYVNNSNLCVLDPNVNSFVSPILLFSSPFNYTENVGSLKTLTYSEYLYSTFSGANSIPSNSQASTAYNSAENSYLSNVGNPSFINQGETFNAITNTIPPGALAAQEQTKLASYLSGYGISPYEATWKTEQKISQHKLYIIPSTAAEYWCFTNPLTLPPYNISRTWDYVTNVITYGSTSLVKSNLLSEPVEGGNSYAKYLYNNTFYQQALNATIIPKNLLFDLLTDRIFGSVYANYTLTAFGNTQVIINATRLFDYWITHYWQGTGLHPYYETISPKPVSPQCYGTTCIFNPFGLFSTKIPNNMIYTASPIFTNQVSLFNFYQTMLFANYTFLNFTGTGSSIINDPYGYHRIILIFNDRFNNNIYLPLDADVANITQIGLQVNPSVSGSNANQTALTISGNLNYTPLFTNQQIPLSGGTVYLYYDANLNFKDYNPLTDTVNVQLCAFGIGPKVPKDCQLANPNWLYPNPPNPPSPNLNALIPTYNPSYGSSGSCLASPSSLLQPVTYNCNIYGNDGKRNIPNTCLPNQDGNLQYCSPIFGNGTGLCTSQMGLIGTATTDSNGHFTYTTTACGYGYAKILAAFYGEPTPQPLQATQSPIEYAYNPSYSGTNDQFNATDYSWATAATQTSTPIGALFLNYGSIGYIYIVSAIIIASLLLSAMYARNRAPRVSNAKTKAKEKNRKHKERA